VEHSRREERTVVYRYHQQKGYPPLCFFGSI